MSNKYYVYALIDPRDNQPFYIGKGSGNRCHHHLTQTYENTDNRYKTSVIIGLRNIGLEPIVEKLREHLDENSAYELEEKLINQYGKRIDGGILTNICDDNRPPTYSGEDHWTFNIQTHPLSGRKLSETTKEKISKANKIALNEYYKHHDNHMKGKTTGKPAWNRGTSGVMKPNKTSFKKGSTPWNIGTKYTDEMLEAHKKSQQARRNREKASKRFYFLSPHGETFVTDSFNDFCDKYGINRSYMRCVYNGTHGAKSSQGWKRDMNELAENEMFFSTLSQAA